MAAEPEIGISLLMGRLKDHALGLGRFTGGVVGHEPKNAPPDMTGALWVTRVRPSILSNLASDAALVVCMFRGYALALTDPADDVEVRLVDAIDALVGSFSGGFTLDGAVVAIDALGSNGDPLGWVMGYVTVAQTLYRVADLTIPIICHDTWVHTP